MSAHTPGSWEVALEIFDNGGIPETVIQALNGRAAVAVALEFGPNNPGMRDANARLIAASPDLYAALLNARSFIATDRASMVECCTGPNGEIDEYDASAIATYDELLAQIDAAIVKADGELMEDKTAGASDTSAERVARLEELRHKKDPAAIGHLHSNGDFFLTAIVQSSAWPVPLYTAPSQREWHSLTDDERKEIFESMPGGMQGFLRTWGWLLFSKALEQKLKEKNVCS